MPVRRLSLGEDFASERERTRALSLLSRPREFERRSTSLVFSAGTWKVLEIDTSTRLPARTPLEIADPNDHAAVALAYAGYLASAAG